MRTYYIGLLKDGERLIIQATASVDCLSCQLWKYYGQRMNTKKNLRKNAKELMHEVNKSYGTQFTKVQVQ